MLLLSLNWQNSFHIFIHFDLHEKFEYLFIEYVQMYNIKRKTTNDNALVLKNHGLNFKASY